MPRSFKISFVFYFKKKLQTNGARMILEYILTNYCESIEHQIKSYKYMKNKGHVNVTIVQEENHTFCWTLGGHCITKSISEKIEFESRGPPVAT